MDAMLLDTAMEIAVYVAGSLMSCCGALLLLIA